ncbi:hypothetical protein ACFT7S_17375 [Streptomyces sp. NPDC057136]|uniref:hypothetical protein n=1 Tax=Streptomyces sp. NPDC057136 TaxID=3346029 RepID=UPI003627146D
MRYRTGLDADVCAYVVSTPGAQLLAHNAAMTVRILMGQARPAGYTVAVGVSAAGTESLTGLAVVC